MSDLLSHRRSAPGWFRACLVAWLGLVAPAAGAAPASTAAQAAEARALQTELPTLAGRAEAAKQRSVAAQRWFAGEAEFATAFPDLAGAPLLDPAWLSARLLALDAEGEARAAARVAPVSPDLSAPLSARLQAARSETLDAESAAAELERRLVLGLRTGLSRAPDLRAGALSRERAALAKARALLGEPDPAEEQGASIAEEILALGAAETQLAALEGAVIRALTVPGDKGLERIADADLARLEQAAPPEDPAHAAQRLQRLQPLLEGTLQARARAALQARARRSLTDERSALADRKASLEAALETIDPAQLTGSVADHEAALERAQATLRTLRQASPTGDAGSSEATAGSAAETTPDSTPAAGGPSARDGEPIAPLRAEVQSLRLEVGQLEVEQARRTLSEARRIAALGLGGGQLTKADLEAAEAAAAEAAAVAEAARRTAQDADRLVAEALEATTGLGVTQVQTDKEQQTSFEETRASLEDRLQQAQAMREDALALPPLARARTPALEAAWRAIDGLVQDIRRALMKREETCIQVEQDNRRRVEMLPVVPDDLRAQAEASLVADLDAARDDVQTRSAASIRSCRASLATLSTLQHEAKASRRRLEAAAPRAVGRTLETGTRELWAEAQALVVWASAEAWSLAQLRARDLRLSLQTLLDLLFSSIELVLVFGLWLLGRRSAPRVARLLVRRAAAGARQGWAQGLAGQLEHIGVEISPLSWRGLGPAVQPVLVSLVDVTAGCLTFVVLLQASPFVAFPVLAWTVWQVRGLGVAIVRLTLSMPSNTTVDAPLVTPQTRALAERTVRVVVTWWAAQRVLTFVSLQLFDADRITELLQLGFLLLGLGVLTSLLSRWHSRILEALALQEPVRWTAWLPATAPSLLRPAHAALALGLLAERWTSNALNALIANRAGLSWVGAALARQRLRDAEEDLQLDPLPRSVSDQIRAQPVPPEGLDELGARLLDEHARWCNSDARGMVAVVGDHGMGKSSLLASFVEAIPSDFPVRRLTPPVLCHDAEMALSWLASACGVPLDPQVPLDQRASLLAVALLQQEPQVFVLDDTERLLLRTVGGYRALRRVMNILHATSGRHLWVCAMHGPTWYFLKGLPQAVNLALFRTTVELRPVGAARMATWLENQTRAAGLVPNYRHLLPENTLDSARAEARVRTAFWLLLTEESAGNPRVAMEYWLSALRQDGENSAAVVRFAPPRVADLADQPDRDLFVLTALALHDALTVDEMAESLNLAPAIVRSTSRKLESLGILAEHDDGYRITLRWQPIVGRVLRDKQFVHGA